VHGICPAHGIIPVSGVCLRILNSYNISGLDGAMLFKFAKWVEYGRVHPSGEHFPLKGAWSGSRDPFNNFKPPSIFLEWVKLRSLNLASGLTMASPTPGIKIFSWKGVVWVTWTFWNFKPPSVFLEWMKPCSLNFANASTMASATLWVKNSIRNQCGVGNVTAVLILTPLIFLEGWGGGGRGSGGCAGYRALQDS